MPTTIPGAGRRDAFEYPPENIRGLRVGQNARYNPGDDGERLVDLDLAVKIAAVGQIQDGVVRRDNEGYVLVVGSRRRRAILLINERPDDVRAHAVAQGVELSPEQLAPRGFRVRFRDLTEEQALRLNVSENLDRLNLSAVSLAYAAQLFSERGWSQARIGAELKCSASRVGDLLRLLASPSRVLDLVHAGVVTEAAARALRGLPGEVATAIAERIVAGEKPASVLAEVRASRRNNGVKVALSLAEAKRALEGQGSDQALALAAWLRGEAGLEDCRLEDWPAVDVGALRKAAAR